MSKDNEINFNTFEEFYDFSLKEGKNIEKWSPEKIGEFNDRVMDLYNNNPDFKTKYDKYLEDLEAQTQKPRAKKLVVDLGDIEGSKDKIRKNKAMTAYLKRMQKKVDEKEACKEEDNKPKRRYVIGKETEPRAKGRIRI